MKHLVGIGEYAVSDNEEDTIKTFALASCIAITAYVPGKKVAGMIHIALPRPASEEEGKLRPFYYVTTGIPIFLDMLTKKYCCLTSELNIQIFGGANSINKGDIFNIGMKNIEMAVNILSGMKLKPLNLEVGGEVSRTIELYVTSGSVSINTYPINI